MKVLTSIQMREIDRRAIEEIGIPGSLLMENAGIGIMSALEHRFSELEKEKIVIVAGKGNNGGDGLVVARCLRNRDAPPVVLLLGRKKDLRGEAAVNLKIALNMGIPVLEILSLSDWKRGRKALSGATLIIDALFGTGLAHPLQGLYARAVEDINASEAFKVAVDLPSGLSADTFVLIGPCVKADMTVALAAPKIAHLFPPAEECVGGLVVAPIGIPSFLFDDPNLKLELVEGTNLLPSFKKRNKDAHKGTFGHLFAVCGSLGKTGAASMAGRAALRMGAGLVTMAVPESCLSIVARSSSELMTEPLAESAAKTVSETALPRVLELLEGKNALLLGPGISTHPSTAEFVRRLLPRVRVPMVIDADGLNIIASKPDILDSLKAPAVLTPHPGEFARLLGRPTAEVMTNRLEMVPAFAARYHVHLVFKGYRTLTACPDGRIFINPTGNPGMAAGGSGDVLSGMITSQIMQEKDLLGAVLSAVFAHGLSGDIAAEETGQKALGAGDIIRRLPRALKALEERGIL